MERSHKVKTKVNKSIPKKDTKTYQIVSESFGGSNVEDWGPIVTPEQEADIQDLYKEIDKLNAKDPFSLKAATDTPFYGSGLEDGFDPGAAWIQTFSGRRFNPTNPNPEAIVIQDIAHALSMQCRFSGHCKKFYSVAQHSVYVSYICNDEDALYGLLHDSSEAFLVDIPRPLKHSGTFQAYIDFETVMQKAVCKRFGLDEVEPASVKRADSVILSTEARDLMSPHHPDWRQTAEPLPFIIDPWDPSKAEHEFLKRFSTLYNR